MTAPQPSGVLATTPPPSTDGSGWVSGKVGAGVYVAVALLAALPSLLWALDGSALLHDDWSIAQGVEQRGVWHEVISRSTGSPARPLTALYLCVLYGLFGTASAPQVLLLAALNAASAVLVLEVARRLIGFETALWVALAWAVLPNRGSTRLWSAMGPAMVAVCLLLAALILLLHGRPVAAGLVLALGVLAYEAVAGIGLAALALWAWRARPPMRRVVVSTAPIVFASALIFLLSPKWGGGDRDPLDNATRLIPAQLGTGVFGSMAPIGALVLLGAITVALARLLPSFRPALGRRDRCVLGGLVVMGLGAGPFLVAGFPFTTDGILDRANVTAALGTAILLGGVLWWVASRGVAGVAAALVLIAYVGSLNGVDLHDYRAAARDGRLLQVRLAADVPHFSDPLVVGPPLPNRGGAQQFITDYDLSAFLRLARDDPALVARMAITAEDFETATEPLRYDWSERRFTRRSP